MSEPPPHQENHVKAYKLSTDDLPDLLIQDLVEGLKTFGIDDMEPGQVITLEIIEISQMDLEALPEWEP